MKMYSNECIIVDSNNITSDTLYQIADTGYKAGYRDGLLDAANKTENRPIQSRSTDAWVNIPEASDKDPKQAIREEIGELKDKVDDLNGRIKRLEAVVFYGGEWTRHLL